MSLSDVPFVDDTFTFVGYHGTSSEDVDAILAHIDPPSGRNYDGWSQLGPGFYVTMDRRAAALFAENAVLERGGRPVLVEVYAYGIHHMTSYAVMTAEWIAGVSDQFIDGYDYLCASIAGMHWTMQQVKFNPRAYDQLVASLLEPDARDPFDDLPL